MPQQTRMSYHASADYRAPRGPAESRDCEGEKALCAAVIRSAVSDLLNASTEQKHRDSARRFLFTGCSSLPWMASGLGLDVEAVRDGVRARMREAGG